MAPLTSIYRFTAIGSVAFIGVSGQLIAAAPTLSPTSSPTLSPTLAPTIAPTIAPTLAPTIAQITQPAGAAVGLLIEAEDFDPDKNKGFYIKETSPDAANNDIRVGEGVTVATFAGDDGTDQYSVRRVTSGDWFRYTAPLVSGTTYVPTYNVAVYDVNNTGTMKLQLEIVLDDGLSVNPCTQTDTTLIVGKVDQVGVNTGGWKDFAPFIGEAFTVTADGDVFSVCLKHVENFEFDSWSLVPSA